MGSGVPKSAKRVERLYCFLALFGSIYTLGFIDDDYWISFLDELNRPCSSHPVMGTMDDIGFVLLLRIFETFTKGIDIYNHDLDIIVGGEAPYLTEFLGFIDEVVVLDVVVESFEVLFG